MWCRRSNDRRVVRGQPVKNSGARAVAATFVSPGILLAALLFGAGPAAPAEETTKVFRIGYLGAGSVTGNPALLDTFREGLRERGWIEGKNVAIEYRWAEGRFERLPALAAELVALKVDIIAASPTPGVVAAKNATHSIPIVGMGLTDPVGHGVLRDLARPGENVTGVTYSVGSDIFGKDLELLREVVPKVRRVAVLSNPSSPSRPLTLKNIKTAAGKLRLHLQIVDARGPGDFDDAFATMAREGAEALLVITDPAYSGHRARLTELALRFRLPSIFTQREDAEAGALMSYGPRLADLWLRGAYYVDRILRGAKPGDLPVEQPTKFELAVNLKTARVLGLTIPGSVLARADPVIE
jgi:putative ABC transport system substrate-binding protein